VAVRKEREQPPEPGLDQMNAGRLERLQEPRGEPERETIADPGARAAAGLEAQMPGSGYRRALQALQQVRRGFVIRKMRAGIHVAVTDAMLQRNAPLPTRFPCC